MLKDLLNSIRPKAHVNFTQSNKSPQRALLIGGTHGPFLLLLTVQATAESNDRFQLNLFAQGSSLNLYCSLNLLLLCYSAFNLLFDQWCSILLEPYSHPFEC